MKQTAVLFLGLFFHVLLAAQDLPDKIRIDKYMLEALKAIENDDLSTANDKFWEIDQIYFFDRHERLSEPLPEFLFHYGKLLVEQSFVRLLVKDSSGRVIEHKDNTVLYGDFDDHLRHLYKGESLLKQCVLNIDGDSEYYKPALELLLVAEEKVRKHQQQMDEYEDAMQQAALKPMGEMVPISGGTFVIGGFGDKSEMPARKVNIRPFKLGKHEVTFAQWDACVMDGGCKTKRSPDGYWSYDEAWGRGNLPIINVSWDEAQLFIDWLNGKTVGGYRLPTEAEWEYAGRAGNIWYAYSWGDAIGVNQANCNGCGSQWDAKQTAPIGSFPANAWGLHDMHGNVEEWVQDCWHDNYEGLPDDGSEWINDCAYDDSYNVEDGTRVIRGGSWNDSAGSVRSASRNWSSRSNRSFTIGFRLARDN